MYIRKKEKRKKAAKKARNERQERAHTHRYYRIYVCMYVCICEPKCTQYKQVSPQRKDEKVNKRVKLVENKIRPAENEKNYPSRFYIFFFHRHRGGGEGVRKGQDRSTLLRR